MLKAEANRDLRVLHAILGGKRKLEWQRFGPALVVRDIIAFLVLPGSATGYKSFVALADGITHCPKNSLLEKIVKFGVVPDSFVMSGSCVKYPPLAFRPNPSPWFGLLVRITRQRIPDHKNRPVFRVVAMMKVSFVPCLDVLDPRNRGVIASNDPWAEDGALMTFEAPPHELVELGDV